MKLKAIREIYQTELADDYPREEIDSFFYLAIEHYLNLERFILVLRPDIILSKEEESPLFECLSRLKKNEPIQYILGESIFTGLRFMVNNTVLIPRPETEELVYWVLSEIETIAESLDILDIGTGSGCIAVSLASRMPEHQYTALDVSAAALKLAKENALLHQVEIDFRQEDITALQNLDKLFDVIISNPPYVRESEKLAVRKNVKDHEPEIALFVKDDDPLFFYRHIVRFAQANMSIGGSLYLEINQYLSAEIKELLEEENFSEIELREDMFENHRMLKAVWK